MSGLNILGGIGQGLQQGVGFMQQKQVQDAGVQQNQSRLAMLEDEHGWRAKQQEAADVEQQRKGMLDKINQEALLTYQAETGKTDLDRFDMAEVGARAGQVALKSGFLPAEDYARAQETQRALKESGVADLYMRTAMTDDWDGFNKQFSPMFGGATARPVGENIVITTPDGRQSPTSRVGFESLLKMDLTANAQRGAVAGQKTAAEIAKLESEAVKNRASAGKDMADARATASGAGNNTSRMAGDAQLYASWPQHMRDIYDRINKTERNPSVSEVATKIYVESLKSPLSSQRKSIAEATEEARQLTEGVTGTALGASPAGDIPTVRTPAEARKLPSGTQFKTPDGKLRVVP